MRLKLLLLLIFVLPGCTVLMEEYREEVKQEVVATAEATEKTAYFVSCGSPLPTIIHNHADDPSKVAAWWDYCGIKIIGYSLVKDSE